MQNKSTAFNTAIASPMRHLEAAAHCYADAAATTYTDYSDKVMNFTIERIGEDNKFFGFGICQRLNIHIEDTTSSINFGSNGMKNFEIELGVELPNGSIEYCKFPRFYFSEVNRNETNGELSITAYDLIYKTSNISFYDLDLTAPYSLRDCADAAATYLGIEVDGVSGEEWDTEYSEGANFEEADTVRDMLTMLAEATQSIYYIGYDNILHFKRLITSNPNVLNINGDLYTELTFKNVGHRLQTIAAVNELGDNYSASTTLIGSTQYIRDNGFWSLREDIADLMDAALAYAGNMTIYTFDCNWRGNPALEIGDKIGITNKAGNTYSSYVLNDTISFDGTLKERTLWKYENDDAETETNPTSLGDVLKQTYAKVDKANKQITILASKVEEATEEVSEIRLETDSIVASVEQLGEQASDTSETIYSLEQKARLAMTAEDVQIAIQKSLENDSATSVETSTGFTFNEQGLIITKDSTGFSTKIDDNSLSISQDGQSKLLVNDEGVIARDLTAETYLHIGTNSRFEDWQGNRTACFFVG